MWYILHMSSGVVEDPQPEQDAQPAMTFGAKVPLKHIQIAKAIQASIEQGELKPGDRLGGEVELASRMDVSRGTIRRALEELVAGGHIRTERGRGSFVTYSGAKLDEEPGWAQALLEAGAELEVEVLRLELISDPVLSVHLGSPVSGFLATDRLRRLPNGKPVSLEQSRVVASPALRQVFQEKGLVDDSLTSTLAAANLRVGGGQQWLQALELGQEAADLFGVPKGTVYLHALRIAKDQHGEPLEQVSSILDPEYFSFHTTF